MSIGLRTDATDYMVSEELLDAVEHVPVAAVARHVGLAVVLVGATLVGLAVGQMKAQWEGQETSTTVGAVAIATTFEMGVGMLRKDSVAAAVYMRGVACLMAEVDNKNSSEVP